MSAPVGSGAIDQDFYHLIGHETEIALREQFTVARPSRGERIAAGRALRQKVPRSAHATYESARRRADPVAVLEQQNATRIAKLVPVRMARMVASPFAFLRR